MDALVFSDLKSAVGESRFSRAEMDLWAASFDASDWQNRPEALVWPESADQVSAVLILANQHHFPVTVRGAGTGLVGSAIPIGGGVVLDMSRMNRILEIRLEDRYVKVQPGVIYQELDQRLAPLGFAFPPDPASGPSCTLGGNVSTNAGGIRGAKYGVTRDYLLGLEVVLPQGQIIRTGCRTMKSVSGIPLTGLFCGSEGVLGVITEITLKISPRAKTKATGLALFDRLEDAGQAIARIARAGIVPAVMELMDQATIDMLIDGGGFDLPRVAAMLLIETDGLTATEAAAQMEGAADICRQSQSREIRLAASPREAAALWHARRSIGPISMKCKPNAIVEDVTVPMSRIPDLLEGIQVIAQKHDLLIINFGHCGDGNLHPQIMFDLQEENVRERVDRAARDIFQLACDLGGTLSGEHGIGLSKADFLKMEHQNAELEIMKGLKHFFDPNNVLNPGKMSLGGLS